MKFAFKKFVLLFTFLFIALNVNAAPPIFTCPAIITNVFATNSSAGSFQINSIRPDGLNNSPTFVTDDRTSLLAMALTAETNGNPVTLVVQPTEGNDTRCRDVNEPLLLLAVIE